MVTAQLIPTQEDLGSNRIIRYFIEQFLTVNCWSGKYKGRKRPRMAYVQNSTWYSSYLEVKLIFEKFLRRWILFQMRIPLEHFQTTPVFALGPSQPASIVDQNSSEHESDGSGSSKWFKSARKRGASTLGVPGTLWGSNSAGSAPTSPVFSRKFSSPTPSSGPSSCFSPIEFQKSQLMASSLTSFVETEEEDEYAEDRSSNFGAKSLNYGGPCSLQPQSQKTSRSYFGR